MVQYTEQQQKIAKLLLENPRTLEQLRDISQMPANELNEALKELIKLKVVDKQDELYKLVDIVTETVKPEPKHIEERYRVKIIIEGLSKSEEALEKQMDNLEQKLKAEPYAIKSFEKSSINDVEKNFAMFFDIDIAVPTFKDLVYVIVNYGPSSIEIIHPSKIELPLSEAQEALNDMSSAVHYYISLIAQMYQGKKLVFKELDKTEESEEKKQPETVAVEPEKPVENQE